MKIPLAAGVLMSLAIAFPASAQAQPSAEGSAVDLIGQWTGTSAGFEAGTFVKRSVRYKITRVNGQSFTGIKSWRVGNGQWSEGEEFQGALHKTGEFLAADDDGIFIGELTSSAKITGTYLESGEDSAALTVTLSKR